MTNPRKPGRPRTRTEPDAYLALRLPRALLAALAAKARAEDRTVAAEARRAIAAYLAAR